jgi:hypothetical protein
MKGKSRKILLLTWPFISFFDGQPSAFTKKLLNAPLLAAGMDEASW